MNKKLTKHLYDANVKSEVTLNTFNDLFDYDESNRREQPTESLLTQEEVISILKVSKMTLCVWRTNGSLPAIRVGREVKYREADIAALVKRKGGEVA